ncbi:MAG: PAS domain-containing protein [Rhodospirillaceae bacterium]|nr:PAS domain-containing protein [Rhodospirillaceae bacterium]
MPTETTVLSDELTHDTVASERLRRLHSVWDGWRGERRWPSRADIRPEDIAFMLGTVHLIDVLRAPLRFRLRLVGSAIEELGRRGDQGKMIEEIDPPFYARMLQDHYSQAVEKRVPLFHRVTFVAESRPTRHPMSYERIILPLSADGQSINMLIAASDWSKDVTLDLRRFHHGD